MCAQESDCGAQASCIAGRCVAHGATPAIDNARRLAFAPVDVAVVRRGENTRDAVTALLGRAGDDGSLVLLRFAATLPPEANVLEAYVVLERAADVDADPVPITVHAARVVDRWDGRSVTWGNQPRLEEVSAPLTRVSPSSGELVRIDVREIVRRWRAREHDDFGLAVVAEGSSPTGIAFALVPGTSARDRLDPVLASSEPRPARVGPRLELYVK
jgi:hypothetical protein